MGIPGGRCSCAPHAPDLFLWDGCDAGTPAPADLGPHRVAGGYFRIWLGPVRARIVDGAPVEVTRLVGGTTGWTLHPSFHPSRAPR